MPITTNKIKALRLSGTPAAAMAMLLAGCAGPSAGPVACSDLTGLTVAQATIESAESVAAGSFRPPAGNYAEIPANYAGMPAFCRVTGSIRPTPGSDIRFEVWLPAENWNGKFVQTGNGGAAGSVLYFTMPDPLSRGYAVANNDTGHSGGGGDFSWVSDSAPEKLDDFRYRAVHEMTPVGKAITEAHYGKPAAKSYFVGCSTGGRQGLMEAQRFPGDYDAIVAGAPANHWTKLLSETVLTERNVGPGGLGLDKLGLLKEAAIAACDADDGVSDRVIAAPGECDFDPADLTCSDDVAEPCLTQDEVAAAQQLYAGLVDADGNVIYPGTGPGSEPGWGAFASPSFRIGSSWYRHVVMKDPDWDAASFDVDSDFARAAEADGGTTATDPDLSAFIARGGKLLTYHGTTDGLIPYGGSVAYYESVVDTLGADAIRDSVKFYLVPGMDHCAGGEGTWMVDWIAALERWAEDGETPGALHGEHPPFAFGPPGTPAGKPFSRPLCPYPQVARYDGEGDVDDAASFACVDP